MKNKVLTKGAISLSTLLLLGTGISEVKAATAVVNYKEGATTVWSSPNKTHNIKKYLTNNQKVNVTGKKVVNGATWYKLNNAQWVPAAYLTVSGTVADAADTVTAAVADGTVTVWSSPTGKPTEESLSYKETKDVKSTKKVNGQTWYEIADGWVVSDYVAFNNPDLENNEVKSVQSKSVSAVAESEPTNVQPSTQTQVKEQSVQNSQQQVVQQSQQLESNNSQGTSNEGVDVNTDAYSGYANNNSVTNSTNQNQVSNTNNASGNAQTVISAAMSQIGVPYVWGAASPGVGFDCSGLTQYAFGQAGISLAHYTVAQESAGQRVSISQLQPGDLVFWGAAGATYHVGIYTGNGQYIAAPAPGQNVSVQSISSYFMPSFGVRVF